VHWQQQNNQFEHPFCDASVEQTVLQRQQCTGSPHSPVCSGCCRDVFPAVGRGLLAQHACSSSKDLGCILSLRASMYMQAVPHTTRHNMKVVEHVKVNHAIPRRTAYNDNLQG